MVKSAKSPFICLPCKVVLQRLDNNVTQILETKAKLEEPKKKNYSDALKKHSISDCKVLVQNMNFKIKTINLKSEKFKILSNQLKLH